MNFYVKDLNIFNDNYDLKDIIIIDNSILSFAYHINNGIPVVPFYDSNQDSELPLLSFYLLSIVSYKDLREVNKEHIRLEYYLSQFKKEISQEEITILERKIGNDINNNKSSKNASVKNIDSNDANENKNEMNNDINKIIGQFDFHCNKNNDDNVGNKSEKKIIIGFRRIKSEYEKKKFNTVKLESSKILGFFEKWKNAYLQLALKK
jgi:hypothetical protein